MCFLLAGVSGYDTPAAGQLEAAVTRGQVTTLWEKGSLNGPEDAFSRLGSAALDPRRATVAETQTLSLYEYGPSGALRFRLGRSGQGPGEFRSIGNIIHVGDTTFVTDVESRSISAFINGSFLEKRVVALGARAGKWPSLQARLPRGELLVAYREETEAAIMHNAEPIRMLVLWPNQEIKLDLGNVQRARTTIEVAIPGGGLAYIGAPALREIAHGTLLDLSSDGRFLAIARTDARARVLRVAVWNIGERQLRRLNLRFRPEPVPTDVVKRIAVDLVRSDPSLDDRDEARVHRAIENQVHPNIYPPATALTVANTGELWFKVNGSRVPRDTWLRFDPRTSEAVQVQLGPREIVAAAYSEYLLTTRPTADIPKLRLARLTW